MKHLLTIEELNASKNPKSILTALSFGISIIDGRNYLRTVKCICKCGNSKIIAAKHFKSGHFKSCGCLTGGSVKHGLTKKGNIHPLYHIWANIKSRCNPNLDHPRKHRYSQRGINICDEWANDFQRFYDWCIANGWKQGLQIDRINNDGNYEPSNCRIVTNKVNASNKEDTKYLEYDGKRMRIPEWAELLQIKATAIRWRVRNNLPIERVLWKGRLGRGKKNI